MEAVLIKFSDSKAPAISQALATLRGAFTGRAAALGLSEARAR
jgi:hypothetical protein